MNLVTRNWVETLHKKNIERSEEIDRYRASIPLTSEEIVLLRTKAPMMYLAVSGKISPEPDSRAGSLSHLRKAS